MPQNKFTKNNEKNNNKPASRTPASPLLPQFSVRVHQSRFGRKYHGQTADKTARERRRQFRDRITAPTSCTINTNSHVVKLSKYLI